ncbi:Hsp70 family protein [Flavilitoribacter nigricans]|uniref:Molecular chaperone DnaK n=1 Tax=Flavilitoribacter nigricans (strain ATCC 23147 / DSM 23189 / NBRC 102662 / NCIMB 1420 / SS-2) TaxID=1122177 RepID=A0A2D0MWZ7_FLAN2|nr:Hsp70 family protein [Flavilitoribacter nigricans]PHN00727.1 hypothetical protein CRP01_40805 [Flavilitoribacter nigricans DSM 23189 = NBRC 102662]
MSNQNIILGIDLGTTYSAMAYVDEHGDAKIIPNSDNERITPSVVFFETSDNIIVGKNAKDEAEMSPESVVSFVKREMGKKKDQVRIEEISPGIFSDPKPYTFFGTTYAPETISSLILKKLKSDAEKYFNGQEIKDAVITVPAYFNESEKKATKDAGTQAGLNVLQIINEPTAAAIAYGLEGSQGNEKVFVFDLGGGTFDITILDIKGSGDSRIIDVIDSDGDHKLGGKDWDDAIINYACEQYSLESSENPREDLEGFADLRNRAENLKKQLSEKTSSRFNMSCHGDKVRIEIDREQFKELTQDLMTEVETMCEILLKRNKLTWDQIDTILLVGGSTRMPMIKEMLTSLTGKDIRDDLVQPDECVALGAAMRGVMIKVSSGSPDVAALSEQVVEKYGSNSLAVNDILSKSIGTSAYTRLEDGSEAIRVSKIFERRMPLPNTKSKQFYTRGESSTGVPIDVLEGESDLPENCRLLTEKTLEFNRPMPKGSPIEITFSMDHSGLLHITARDLTDGAEIKFEIERKDNLSALEIAEGTALVGSLNVE